MATFKVVLPKEETAQRASLVERFTGNPNTLPAVAGVQIVVTKGGVLLRATNLEEFIEATLPAKVEGEGSVVVPGSVFSQVIHTNKDERITLTYKDGVLSVGDAKLRTLPDEDFPSPSSLDGMELREVEGEVFAQLFDATLPAVATSTIKPELTGVYCNIDETECVAAATDSFRLAEKRLPLEKGPALGGFILPRRSVVSILRIIDKKQPLTITHNTKQCQLSVGSITYITRLIEGTFPDYERIIPTSFATQVVVQKDAFTYALKRAAIFSDQFSYVRVKVSLEGGKGTVTLLASNQEVGEIKEYIEAQGEGEAQEIGFNLRYLQEGVAPITTQEVLLQFVGGNKPLVISGKGDTTYRYLVMPMNR